MYDKNQMNLVLLLEGAFLTSDKDQEGWASKLGSSKNAEIQEQMNCKQTLNRVDCLRTMFER